MAELGAPRPPEGPRAEFVRSAGEPAAATANVRIDLHDPDRCWHVEDGALDVFYAEYSGGRQNSASRHLLRVQAGSIAFGVDPTLAEHGIALFGKGLPGTVLRKLPTRRLIEASQEGPEGAGFRGELAEAVDLWISRFAASVASPIDPKPPLDLRISPSPDGPEIGRGVVAARSGVVWLRGEKLNAAFLHIEEALPEGPGLMPVTTGAWVEMRSSEGVSCVSSESMPAETLVGKALPEFHRLAVASEAFNRRLALADEANLQSARSMQRRNAETAARSALADLFDEEAAAGAAKPVPLEAALRAIAKRDGFALRMPDVPGQAPTLREILEHSGLRARPIRLSSEDRWWLGDSGPMLAFRLADQEPVVLLPGFGGRYRILDPATGRIERANAETADSLGEVWLVYRTMPRGGPVATMKELFAVGSGGIAGDAARLVAAGLAAGMLALGPAVAVNLIVGTTIPNGSIGALAHVALVLAAAALVAALAHIARGTALMRLEGRIASKITAAVWDRLLRLRTGFFRRLTAGDITIRAMSFQSLRDTIAGPASEALLSLIFLLPMIFVIFAYDAEMGWVAIGVGVAAIAVTAAFTLALIEPQRRHLQAAQRMAGDLFQFIRGIVKLRVTRTEESAFAAWAARYREQKRAEVRMAVLIEHMAAFAMAIPLIGSAALFAVVLGRDPETVVPADFLAVFTASVFFYVTVGMLGRSIQGVASIVPVSEQVRPILAATADLAARTGSRVALGGQFMLDRINFRYTSDGPLVLKDVSIHARPGELIGIVGESGAGKSTLIRLALGLEEPASGAVFYDGRDLAQMDRGAVRRQIGVVTQDGAMLQGTVLSNILGVGGDLTEDDAWRAARLAAVDRDIAAMPMGMHTAVGENAATFSGGQIQRIRIAAALARNPRILLLDEPTSTLDNETQRATMDGIQSSVATRIVIAHKFSTIRDANRIYVIHAGQVAQVGEFEELLAQDGPFRELANRQIA